MKVMVTGGAGFIGSNFVRYLLNIYGNDIQILNIDNLSYGSNISNVKDFENRENHIFINADITDSDRIYDLMNDVDFVVNFAAETHVDRSISDPSSFFRNNAYGTFVLLDAVRRSKGKNKYVQVSSDEVYGTAYGSKSFSENDILTPSSPYSATKAGADMLTKAYHATYGLNTSITRCSNNFGPYQFPEKLIPKTIIRLLLDLRVPLYGSGNQVRDWLYVLDHCEAIRLVMERGKPGEIYNISSGNEAPNLEIVKMILAQLNKTDDLIEHVEDRPGHDIRYSLDSSKIRSELGWKPEHEFNEALKETVNWYLNNESWWRPLATGNILHPTPWKLGW